MKNKEKDLQSFLDEIGIINVIDIESILKPNKKFPQSSLLIQNKEEITFTGIVTSNNIIQGNEIENEEKEDAKDDNINKEKKGKSTNKKKKKKIKEEKKDGESSGSIKLCKREKNK